MSEHVEKRIKKLSPLQKTATVIAVVIALYAVAGFLIVPKVLKSKLPTTISEKFGVTATVNEVKMNPFVLSLTLREFGMKDSSGELLTRFEELYVNFELSSIFRRAYTFSAIRLTAPEGLIRILHDRSVNWRALMPPPETGSPKTAADAGLPAILVQRLLIERGRLDFADLSQRTPFEAQLAPIHISLEDFSTIKDRDGRYRLAATLGKGGDLLWEGTLSVNPLRSRGKLELRGITLRTPWEYIRDRVNFEVTGGAMDVAAHYELDTRNEETLVGLREGMLTLNGFTLAEKGVAETLVSIPLLACRGIGLSPGRTDVSVASVTSSDARFLGWRARDGSVNYQTLFVPAPQEAKEAPPPAPEERAAKKDKTWLITVNSISLKNYGVQFENRTTATPVRISLEPITLTMNNVSTQKDSRSDISLVMNVNNTGTVKVSGTTGISPPGADLTVAMSDIELKPFQPYINTVANLDIVSGSASMDGRVNYSGVETAKPLVHYRGSMRIDGFEADDRVRSEDLLKWKSFVLNDLNVSVQPDELRIAEVVATEPYARIIIRPDGTTNLADVLAKKKVEESGAHPQPEPPPAGERVAEKEKSMPIAINAVRVVNGTANFADMSLVPSFATGIYSLNGTINGLSSDPVARADVAMAGAVDKYAPVKVTGTINPLSPAAYADMALAFQNVELTAFTPYSGKFAGYKIEKGKLSLNLHYSLAGKQIKGENRIFLNQLTLGERVESPTATKLPVTLAIGLLKDRAGNIDIDLPVSGNLDDPEFSYGRIIGRALVTLITRIVTSPFAALGSLIGSSGKELNHVDFAFGSAELAPQEAEKLGKLARALYERPALHLEVRGIADRKVDRDAMAEKAVIRELKELKAEELRSAKEKVPEAVDAITISDDEYLRLLTKASRKRPGIKPPEPLAEKGKPLNVVDMLKQKLIDTMQIEEGDLRQLAQDRAQAIKGYLIQNGTIENNRVFLLEIEIGEAFTGESARIMLSLS